MTNQCVNVQMNLERINLRKALKSKENVHDDDRNKFSIFIPVLAVPVAQSGAVRMS